jgi:fatty-acyl-CoA synthase
MDASHLVAHWAFLTPSKVAVRFEGRHITYEELEHRVSRLAGRLGRWGVGGGDRVAYLGPSCPELLETIFACARLGAYFVPLNARMPAIELRVFVEQARPTVFVTAEELLETARASCAGQVPEILQFTAGGGGVDARPDRVSAWTGAHLDLDPATPVLILFTSGTTGMPKGAVLTHGAIIANACSTVAALGMSAKDEILTFLPMFHIAGLNLLTTPALSIGATVTIHRQFDPGLVLESLSKSAVTLMGVPPPLSLALAAHPHWPTASLGSLRCVMTGGTIVTGRAVQVWSERGIPVVQGYGLTETGGNVTATPLEDAPQKSLTAGKPTMGSQVRVGDASGADVAPGEPGEILARGQSVMLEYFQNPQATRAALKDGWLRTGDVGVIDEEGYLHVMDRIKEIIIVGVSNVYPADLEAILEESPDIAAAAVVGAPDEELGEVPVAFVVPAAGRSVTPEQVLGLFEGRLAAYKQPRRVTVLDALPRTSVGKIEKKALRAMASGA